MLPWNVTERTSVRGPSTMAYRHVDEPVRIDAVSHSDDGVGALTCAR
jgi:hypothetical protein